MGAVGTFQSAGDGGLGRQCHAVLHGQSGSHSGSEVIEDAGDAGLAAKDLQVWVWKI